MVNSLNSDKPPASTPSVSDATSAVAPDTPEVARLREIVELQHRALEVYADIVRSVGAGLSPPPPEAAPRPPAGRSNQPVVPGSLRSPTWWPSHPEPETPLRPSVGHACASSANAQLPVTMILTLGLLGTALETAVTTISHAQRRSLKFAPLFVTDSPEKEIFIIQDYTFEYLPNSEYRTESGRLDRGKVETRLRAIERKWSVASSIDLSHHLDLSDTRALVFADRASHSTANNARS